MPGTYSTAADQTVPTDLISFLKAIPDGRYRRGCGTRSGSCCWWRCWTRSFERSYHPPEASVAKANFSVSGRVNDVVRRRGHNEMLKISPSLRMR